MINTVTRTSGQLSPTLHVATVLLVFGVLLKSAQIPFHGWLQWVMEAPTPVSALLHAGEHLSFGLEPLMRVVLQHSSREMACDRFDDMLRLACLEQIRHHRMAEIVKAESG